MNKKLKTADITLIGCGDAVTLTAQDTATEPIAKYALDAFSVENQMHFKNGDAECYVPFHAVDHIEVTETTESVADRPDPYGCDEGGSEPVSEVWATITSATGRITLQSDSTKEESGATTNKQYADWLDVLNNHSNYAVKANMNCGEVSMEYNDILPGITYEHEGYTVAIVLSQGTIIVAADQQDDCVPIEIIVTKK